MSLGPNVTQRKPPTATLERVADQDSSKRNQRLMPDEIPQADYARGPWTFGGQDLGLRLNPDLTAADGSMSLYSTSMALKRRFEYMTSSPEGTLINAELSKWTTRTWTLNIQSGREYLVGLVNWLKLDWVGRPPGRGSRSPLFASGNASLAFYDIKRALQHESGD